MRKEIGPDTGVGSGPDSGAGSGPGTGAGSGAIEFARVRGGTIVGRALARSPLRLLQPKNQGSAAWIYTSLYGGGLVGGDQVDLRVRVGPGAHAVLLSQASTKVYRSRGDAPLLSCAQRLHAEVEGDGMLAVLPDAMCCFAGSRYSQEQRIDLAPGASLALCDWVTAGRCAFGERWAFLRYHSKLVVCREGRRIVHDALLLDPEDGPLHAGGLAGRLGRFEALGTIVLCGPLLLAAAGTLLDEVAGMPLSRRAEVLLSAGPVPGGAILRLAATSAERLALALRHALRALPVFLGDDPWARKF